MSPSNQKHYKPQLWVCSHFSYSFMFHGGGPKCCCQVVASFNLRLNQCLSQTPLHLSFIALVNVSFTGGFLHAVLLSASGRRSASPHDPEEGVDVVALDGIPARSDHLVLGFSH
ncbi:hypothetical protein GOODEAATRI_010538 [Goodea atripinnis]|uniref:Uncharacterized protein n=1 Tax=Goodea atripinnis TaxID=208336 RepID=A0ABV0MGQ2_9TELE